MRILLLITTLLISMGPLVARTGQVAERIMALKGNGARFEPVQLLHAMPVTDALNARWKDALRTASVLRINGAALEAVVRDLPEHITLELPGHIPLVLDLQRTTITTDDFVLTTASGIRSGLPEGAHYRGMVRGLVGSWAAISLFKGEVMGLINDGTNTIVVGRFDDRADDLHVLYREEDLLRRNPASCDVRGEQQVYHPSELAVNGADRTVRCVRYYWEVNHNVFLDKGNIINTTNYITGLFNQTAILFDNDGIDVTLSELFIWDVVSPYTGPSSGNFLDQFGVTRTSFNGDLAHLIGYGGGGGVAWLNTLCNSQAQYRMAYSGINSTYSNVPTYSWSVNVITHEQGHNLGSSHTHGCVWNGNGTAIDGCGPAAGYSEGGCAAGPVPTSAVGGTIMSYCHLVSAGIRFQNGFGPQPTALIVNRVNSATCLTTCGTTCDAPGNLNVANLTTTSAALSWSSVGASGYTLRWKPVSSGTWTVVTGLTGNTYALSGLIQSTAYEFQVLSICGVTSSAYSGSRNFTTPTPCPDALEPNNTLATAANITLPATISALIAVNGDQDYYRFTTTALGTITASIANLAGDYDLRLLNNVGATLASSEAGGTTSEFITYPNAPAGTYHVQVFGYNGAFSATQCYALEVRYFPPACAAPQGVAVTDISYSSATVSWSASSSAASYDLRYKPTADVTWMDVTGIVATTVDLNGLSELTSYDVQVRAVCSGVQGGTANSEYSSLVQFTTLANPCGVQFWLRMFLDGAYRSSNGLMTDSLRANGLLPLEEPYTALGYSLAVPATTTPAVLAVEGPDAITDWVIVEIRGATAPFTVLERRAALLQRDGDVVGVNGEPLLFFCVPYSAYYRIAVHHRNHLAAMTGEAIFLTPMPGPPVNFGSAMATYGDQAQRLRDGKWMLWAGDASADGTVKYAGEANDRDAVLFTIGGLVPTNTVVGYHLQDLNLDGVVKYSGTDNDRDVILNSIGGLVPTTTIIEQMP